MNHSRPLSQHSNPLTGYDNGQVGPAGQFSTYNDVLAAGHLWPVIDRHHPGPEASMYLLPRNHFAQLVRGSTTGEQQTFEEEETEDESEPERRTEQGPPRPSSSRGNRSSPFHVQGRGRPNFSDQLIKANEHANRVPIVPATKESRRGRSDPPQSRAKRGVPQYSNRTEAEQEIKRLEDEIEALEAYDEGFEEKTWTEDIKADRRRIGEIERQMRSRGWAPIGFAGH